jgi:hypothetical protein
MEDFRKALEIKPLPNYKLWLKFDNGEEGSVDLSHMVNKGVFKAWQNPENFKKAHIVHDNRAIAWSEDLDICVDSLYMKATGKTVEDLFGIEG